jgi:hypothetical protein
MQVQCTDDNEGSMRRAHELAQGWRPFSIPAIQNRGFEASETEHRGLPSYFK